MISAIIMPYIYIIEVDYHGVVDCRVMVMLPIITALLLLIV